MDMSDLLKSWSVRIALLVLLLLPFLLWLFREQETLHVVVVDKTVPRADYREHAGLFWLLAHRRYVGPAGDPYRIQRDYYGFRPGERAGDTELRIQGEPDLLYVADTYGVYRADLEGRGNPRGRRSPLVYGGLTPRDWEALHGAKTPDNVLVMEFNSIATPTAPAVRRAVERALGLRWTGWIGRYFPDLRGDEVPHWLEDSYEQQYGEPWNFRGGGVALVHESSRVVVLDGDDVRGGVRFVPTEEGLARYPGIRAAAYGYWFDVVRPGPSMRVEAEFRVGLTPEGERVLRRHGLPGVFPAVLRDPAARQYYLAGDFADVTGMASPRWVGSWGAQRAMSRFMGNPFFWRAYLPVLDVILAEAAGRGPADP